jgi:DNA-binding transcriptional LysR family regulator
MTSSIQVHSALLNSGRYLSTLPSSALHFTSKQLALKILPVDLGIPPWPIAITALKNRTESPVARVFLECAREVAKPLTNRKL